MLLLPAAARSTGSEGVHLVVAGKVREFRKALRLEQRSKRTPLRAPRWRILAPMEVGA